MSQQTRLIAAAEQRKKLKEDTIKFGDLFYALNVKFGELEDDIPMTLRRIMKDLCESDFYKKVLEKTPKERAAPPSDEEKLTRPKEYARCEHCEKVIQIRLMKLHQQRAICAETAKTRLTDVKLIKASKDKTEMPRIRVKERVTLLADYNEISEDEVVKKLVNRKNMPESHTASDATEWREDKPKKLSEDFIEDSEDDDRVLTPILEEQQVPPPSYEEEFVPIPVPVVVAEPVAEMKKIVIKKKLNIKPKGKLVIAD